jgi:hypothetical protein
MKKRKRTITTIAVLVLLCVLVWHRFRPPSSAFAARVIAQADYPKSELGTKQTVSYLFITSPFVIEGTVQDIHATALNARDSGEGWSVASVKPSQIHKGLFRGESLLVSSLGNQKITSRDLSLFSMNRQVNTGDKCVAFLTIDWFLTRKCRRVVYECKRVIVLKNTENTTNASTVTNQPALRTD